RDFVRAQKSHQRKLVDGSDPTYRLGPQNLRIPPTEVGGWFRSQPVRPHRRAIPQLTPSLRLSSNNLGEVLHLGMLAQMMSARSIQVSTTARGVLIDQPTLHHKHHAPYCRDVFQRISIEGN